MDYQEQKKEISEILKKMRDLAQGNPAISQKVEIVATIDDYASRIINEINSGNAADVERIVYEMVDEIEQIFAHDFESGGIHSPNE